MKELWNTMQLVISALGGWLGWFLGGCDGLLYALIAFVVIDYITGVMCAVADHAELAEVFITEGKAEGVRGDIAFAQSLLETGNFTFKGDVKASQNNFAGLGATGGGVSGNVFVTPTLGICGDCNKVFARKGWRSSTGIDRKVWQCSERYKVKGVMGCANRHVEEETLVKAYLMAWNTLLKNKEDFMAQWKEQLQSENLLEGYRAEKFIEYTDGAEPLTEMDTDFMLKTLDHIKVFEDGTLTVVFLDGTEIECKNEEV